MTSATLSAARRAAIGLVAGLALAVAPSLAAHAAVSPATVETTADPGATVTVTKTITTPVVAPKPDIVLVVDETGSMATAISNVKAELGSIMTTVKAAQPTAQFAVASYRDVGEPRTFVVGTDLSGDQTAVQSAIGGLTAGGGGDGPEAQLNALWQIGGGGDAISFRPDSSRIVVWFGDAAGHDPSNGHTEADAIASLAAVDARVIAINVGAYGSLDATGQATRITAATDGIYYTGVTAGQVATTILDGLRALPVTVTADSTCDAGLAVSFDPALPRTVDSGASLVLQETIRVAKDAPQGATLGCETRFLVNGVDAGPDFTQTVRITVGDSIRPTVSCGPGVNPDGVTPPGWKKAGFFQLVASDNLPGVTVTVTDSKTGESFGPYEAGTYIKLTQGVGGPSTVTPFEGAVDWHMVFSGDATLTATDAAGNTSTATCKVPPLQK